MTSEPSLPQTTSPAPAAPAEPTAPEAVAPSAEKPPASPAPSAPEPDAPESRWRGEAKKAFAARDQARARLRELEAERDALAGEKTRLAGELAESRGRLEELEESVKQALAARIERIPAERRTLVPEGLPPEARLAYIDRHAAFLFPPPKSPPQGGAKPGGDAGGRSFRELSGAERAALRQQEPERYRQLAEEEQLRQRRAVAPEPGVTADRAP